MGNAQKAGVFMFRFCKLVKLALVIALAVMIFHGAYAQGVQHAILSASPYVSSDSILIDFDGQIHEYR